MNDRSSTAGRPLGAADLAAEVAATYGTEAFLSADYARAEKDRLWPRVWQMAGRLEDIPEVGDFLTYDICDDSIIIVRTGPETIKAFHNVCSHRGRQLIDTPATSNGVRGKARNFICAFHGWTYDLDGQCTYILDKDDWHGALDSTCTSLSPVRVDTWGGFIYVDMRTEGESLEEFLGDAGRILKHFELDKMRYKWRQWVIYPANWKTSLEAFMEPYHTTTTHNQLTAYAEFYAYSKAYGLHSVSGFDQRKQSETTVQGGSVSRAGKGADPRVSTYELARENYTTINYSASTDTLIAAAARLQDELPETATVAEVMAHWMKSAKADDAARGVIWPEIPPEVMAEAGLAWSLFPNQNILQGVTFALCYRARPYGDDPDKCIFEAYALERYPEGEEPQTEWVYAEPTEENWGLVLAQDFANMRWVHKGMKSRGFRGALPNPHQEQKIINMHRNLAEFMGRGAPVILPEAPDAAG
ncbi:aromatic ring-hydroxylating dioxygenase subunit alpha [Novosphingobium flavum]|nr:aromatic ring-hydroxylating dioxygenase subunit alpha [Novosphingobium aerophilum]